MERLPELKALIIDSKANNPVKKYSGGWKNEGTGHYPKSAYYGSFLSERLNGAKQSCCTLRDSLVQHTMTSHNGRTRLGKPVSPKEPLSFELVRSLEYHYHTLNDDLEHVRFLFLLLVGYLLV